MCFIFHSEVEICSFQVTTLILVHLDLSPMKFQIPPKRRSISLFDIQQLVKNSSLINICPFHFKLVALKLRKILNSWLLVKRSLNLILIMPSYLYYCIHLLWCVMKFSTFPFKKWDFSYGGLDKYLLPQNGNSNSRLNQLYYEICYKLFSKRVIFLYPKIKLLLCPRYLLTTIIMITSLNLSIGLLFVV